MSSSHKMQESFRCGFLRIALSAGSGTSPPQSLCPKRGKGKKEVAHLSCPRPPSSFPRSSSESSFPDLRDLCGLRVPNLPHNCYCQHSVFRHTEAWSSEYAPGDPVRLTVQALCFLYSSSHLPFPFPYNRKITARGELAGAALESSPWR